MRASSAIFIFCLYLTVSATELFSQATDGKTEWLEWKHQTSGLVYATPVISDGTLYIGSTDSLFYAIDAFSGKVIWIAELDCRIWGSAAINEERIYIGSNSLYVIDKDSGSILKQHEFPQVHEAKKYGEYTDRTANFHSSPVLYDGMIILGSDDGIVYAIREL